MIVFEFPNKTPSADILINLNAIVIKSDELFKYEDKAYFEELCKKGCPNYESKWSCPPCSPSASLFIPKYQYSIVLLMWCDLEQFYYTKTEYMKIKASNSILKSRMDSILDSLETTLEGMCISNGSCRLCKPCNKKLQKPCKKPKQARYSMESLGLNVENISEDIFGHKLLWYKDKKAPNYSSVLSLFLTNEEVSNESLINPITAYMESY